MQCDLINISVESLDLEGEYEFFVNNINLIIALKILAFLKKTL